MISVENAEPQTVGPMLGTQAICFRIGLKPSGCQLISRHKVDHWFRWSPNPADLKKLIAPLTATADE